MLLSVEKVILRTVLSMFLGVGQVATSSTCASQDADWAGGVCCVRGAMWLPFRGDRVLARDRPSADPGRRSLVVDEPLLLD